MTPSNEICPSPLAVIVIPHRHPTIGKVVSHTVSFTVEDRFVNSNLVLGRCYALFPLVVFRVILPSRFKIEMTI